MIIWRFKIMTIEIVLKCGSISIFQVCKDQEHFKLVVNNSNFEELLEEYDEILIRKKK